MADNGHDITMPARLGPQNAKAVLGIMVRDALDETGKYLLLLILGRVFHGRWPAARYRQTRLCRLHHNTRISRGDEPAIV
jgi:hypothetical protein